MVRSSRTAQVAWNVQILNSEGRPGVELQVGVRAGSVDEIAQAADVGREGRETGCGGGGIEGREEEGGSLRFSEGGIACDPTPPTNSTAESLRIIINY